VLIEVSPGFLVPTEVSPGVAEEPMDAPSEVPAGFAGPVAVPTGLPVGNEVSGRPSEDEPVSPGF
jgi:hypothetical protein